MKRVRCSGEVLGGSEEVARNIVDHGVSFKDASGVSGISGCLQSSKALQEWSFEG